MSSEILADAEHKMSRAVEAMERDFQGIRTGRASTASTTATRTKTPPPPSCRS